MNKEIRMEASRRSWFWVSEVAELLQLSRSTVYSWIECGKIMTILNVPPYKIPRQEVERFLNPHLSK